MTGIVGMLDPAGVDVALLGRAATVAAHRGKARIVAGDQVAFGVLQRDAEVQVPTVGASG